jgi:hypothetical protein
MSQAMRRCAPSPGLFGMCLCDCWPPRYLTRVTTPIAGLCTRGDRHRYSVVSRFLGSTPSNRRGAHRFIQECCSGRPDPIRGKVLAEPVSTIRSMWTVRTPPISPTSVGRSRRKKVVLHVFHSATRTFSSNGSTFANACRPNLLAYERSTNTRRDPRTVALVSTQAAACRAASREIWRTARRRAEAPGRLSPRRSRRPSAGPG